MRKLSNPRGLGLNVAHTPWTNFISKLAMKDCMKSYQKLFKRKMMKKKERKNVGY